MFPDANMEYVFQNDVLPDIMTSPGTSLGILLENARVSKSKTLQQQDSGSDLDKMLQLDLLSNQE